MADSVSGSSSYRDAAASTESNNKHFLEEDELDALGDDEGVFTGPAAGDRDEADEQVGWKKYFNVAGFLYYLKNSWLEIRKRPFTYFLGAFSVFIVVTIAATVNTMIARAPVLFVQQAELDKGQIDIILTPTNGGPFNFLNYSTISSNLSPFGSIYSYHSPRLEWNGRTYDSKCFNKLNTFQVDPLKPKWKYWGNKLLNVNAKCTNVTVNCIDNICPGPSGPQYLDLIDTDKEKRMGLGRNWHFDPIPPGEAIITENIARAFSLGVGSVFYLDLLSSDNLFLSLVVEGYTKVHGPNSLDNNTSVLLNAVIHQFAGHVVLPIKVNAIGVDQYGKFTDDNRIMMEYSSFAPFYLASVHPILSNWTSIEGMVYALNQDAFYKLSYNTTYLSMSLAKYASLGDLSLYSYANSVVVNLPPNRIEPYISTNYDVIQNNLITFSSNFLYFMGFVEVDISMPILSGLGVLRFFALYLGLILSIILTILFILSTMLLYSLLMISVETTTFTLGVHRMVGMVRVDIVKMLIVQACSYAIPSWALGLIAAQIATQSIVAYLVKAIDVPIPNELTDTSVGSATFLGLFLPLVASILPIRTALNKNIHDTLDTAHSKTKGVEFTIERSEDGGLDLSWLAFGTCTSIFGFLIYYLLPISLLSFNLTLFFNIFFGILLGMLFGLILLSLNLEQPLEKLIVYLLFWWERRSIPNIVLKNLVAHRVRNRKTTIMYALALGFIIFITVAYEMQILSAEYRTVQSYGARLGLAYSSGYLPNGAVARCEEIALKSSIVEEWTWVGAKIGWGGEWSRTMLSNIGHAYENDAQLWPVSPNFYSVADGQFLVQDLYDVHSSLSLSEQLYTVGGSQSVIMGSGTKPMFALDSIETNSNFLLEFQLEQSSISNASMFYQRVRPLAFLDLSPRFGFSKFPSQRAQPLAMSMPSMYAYSNGLYNISTDIYMSAFLLKLKDGASTQQMDNLMADLTSVANDYSLTALDVRVITNSLQKSNSVMTIIFSIATYLAMFLCLFSLIASMYTNIFEQTKEISILRAMGFTKNQILRIYIYEAFTLVLAASLLGICIGFIMSWTMNAQNALFTQLPIPIYFPYQLLWLTIIGSVICAILSAFSPARALLQKPIAQVIRMIF